MYSQRRNVFACVHMIVCALLGCVNAGCPDGWEAYTNKCYLFVGHQTGTWLGAVKYCGMFGGSVAELKNPDIERWVSNRAMQLHRGIWWIGLNDIEAEGRWVWADSRSLAAYYYTNWEAGKPAGNRQANCAGINSNGQWADYSCRDDRRFVCERRINKPAYNNPLPANPHRSQDHLIHIVPGLAGNPIQQVPAHTVIGGYESVRRIGPVSDTNQFAGQFGQDYIFTGQVGLQSPVHGPGRLDTRI